MKRRGFTFIELLVVVATVALLAGIVIPFATGCETKANAGTAEEQQARQTEKLANEAQRQIGMPAIKNFQERKLMKQIIELRDKEDLITYAYIINMHGELVYLGKCVGFGLPYSVQFTSPEKLTYADAAGYHSQNEIPMPQADPNGLYMPQGLSATWLMMLGDDGEIHPVYVEPEIIVSPFPPHLMHLLPTARNGSGGIQLNIWRMHHADF